MINNASIIARMIIVPVLLLLYGWTVFLLYLPSKNAKIAAIIACPIDVVIFILLAPFINN